MSLTASSLSDIEYFLTDGVVTRPAFTDFLNSPTYCPITYSTTISPTPPASLILTLDQATLVYTINTVDINAIAVYTVTTTCLTHRGSDSGVSFNFQLDVQNDPCAIASLTIDSSTLSANPFTYVIGATANVQTLDDLKVTSTETVHTCPTDYEFTIKNRDGTAFNTNLFTWDNVAQTFTTSSSDINLMSTIQLTADVNYAGYAAAGSLDFDVIIDITCPSTTLNTLTVSAMTYTIFETSDTQTLTDPTDTVSVLKSDATFCGSRVYSITSITPSVDYTDFLSIDSATGLITLGQAASTYGDQGTYDVQITVAL